MFSLTTHTTFATLTTRIITEYIERDVGKGQMEVVPSPVCEVYLGSRLVAVDANPRKAWSAITAAPISS